MRLTCEDWQSVHLLRFYKYDQERNNKCNHYEQFHALIEILTLTSVAL